MWPGKVYRKAYLSKGRWGGGPGAAEGGRGTEPMTAQQAGAISQPHWQSHQSLRLVLKQASPALLQALNFSGDEELGALAGTLRAEQSSG